MTGSGVEVDREVWQALEAGLLDGDWLTALQENRRLLARFPDSPGVAIGMGICQFYRREFLECIEWMDRAARLRSRAAAGQMAAIPAVHLFRGLAYAAKRRPAAARADLEQLKAFGPTPIQWDRISEVLRGDELVRARFAAEDSGLLT